MTDPKPPESDPESPEAESVEADAPEAESAEAEASEAEVLEVEPPQDRLPEVEPPEVDAPEAESPEPPVPESADGLPAPAPAVPEFEFYVGSLPSAPPELGKFVRRVIIGLGGLVAILGVLLATVQDPFPDKVYEWKQPRSFVGWIEMEPAPMLVVRRPGAAHPDFAWSRYLLVLPGKFGAHQEVSALQGALVNLEGNLIYRDGVTMVEVVPGSTRRLEMIQVGQDTPPPATVEHLGVHTFVGEIVDSKCFLGVMAPGSTKPHRACAIRCISGGIPPVFLVRQADGRAVYLMLVSAAGNAVNDAVLPMIAEPLEITGRVERRGDLLILRADPDTYTVVDARPASMADVLRRIREM